MKKILFLDIDGVLVTRWSLKQQSGTRAPLDPQCLNHLDRIIKETNCEIVISSSCRQKDLESTIELFKKYDFHKKIVGITIRGYESVIKGHHLPIPRGVEIKAWIDKNIRYIKEKGFVDNDYRYCILDDDSDMLLEQAPYFVKTEFETGLQEIHANQVIEILND